MCKALSLGRFRLGQVYSFEGLDFIVRGVMDNGFANKPQRLLLEIYKGINYTHLNSQWELNDYSFVMGEDINLYIANWEQQNHFIDKKVLLPDSRYIVLMNTVLLSFGVELDSFLMAEEIKKITQELNNE